MVVVPTKNALVLLSLIVVGCTRSQPPAEVTVPPAPSASVVPSSSPRPPPPSTLANPELRVIVPAAEGKNFYFWRPEPTSFFTPSDAEVAAFEARLPAFLRANAKPSRFGAAPLAERMPKYLRQYVGIVEADGRRRVWGNFFCEYFGHPDGGWRNEGFVVKDGGDCYFNVKYDPVGETFSALMVNGEA
jgi:hypothetical protein